MRENGEGRTARLNLIGIRRGELNTCESYLFDPGIWINVPKGHYDTCSDGQCQCSDVGPTFWVKELNSFDPGLNLVRSQVFRGKGLRVVI